MRQRALVVIGELWQVAAVAANADAVSMDSTSVNKSYIGDLYRKHGSCMLRKHRRSN